MRSIDRLPYFTSYFSLEIGDVIVLDGKENGLIGTVTATADEYEGITIFGVIGALHDAFQDKPPGKKFVRGPVQPNGPQTLLLYSASAKQLAKMANARS